MKIVSITSRKGGTSKTETTRALATGLKLRGYNVLMVDADPQRSLSIVLNANLNRGTLYDALTKNRPFDDLIQSVEQGEIITASELLYSIDKENIKQNALEGLRKLKGYDFIVIDTAPNLNSLTAAAMHVSDGVIETVLADCYCLPAIKGLSDETEQVRKRNKNMKVYGILITRYQSNSVTKTFEEQIRKAAEFTGTKCYEKPIRENVTLQKSTLLNKPIFEYSAKSNAAIDYTAFIDEFLKDIQKYQ